MDHPTKAVAFLKGRAVVHGFGTYRGDSSSGYVTWHDGENRKKARTTAAVYLVGVTVHGIDYDGARVDLERAPFTIRGCETNEITQREGEWIPDRRSSYGLRRKDGGTPTWKAMDTLRDEAVRVVTALEEEDPDFFAVRAELYAIGDEQERLTKKAGELEAEAAAMRIRARRLEDAGRALRAAEVAR